MTDVNGQLGARHGWTRTCMMKRSNPADQTEPVINLLQRVCTVSRDPKLLLKIFVLFGRINALKTEERD